MGGGGGAPGKRSEVNTGVTFQSYHVSDVKTHQTPMFSGLGHDGTLRFFSMWTRTVTRPSDSVSTASFMVIASHML